MKVVITGGAGFVGQRLAQALLEGPGLTFHDSSADSVAPRKVAQIVSLDQSEGALSDNRLHYVVGDVADASVIASCIDEQTDVVFHLAAVVSGTAEADFDLGMHVNLDGTRLALERCRVLGHCPRFVFSSSVAVFGGELPAVVTDATMPMPQGSYGIQKFMGELLVQDFSRKGFVHGCSLRLPTVVVRPGKPNGAASSFASAIIREPLADQSMILPVDPGTEMWSASPGVVVANLIHAAQLAPQAWGPWRSLNLPGRVVAMTEALEALERVGGQRARDHVRHQPDADIERLVSTWAARFETPRADALGFARDADFSAMLQAYIDDYPEAVKVPLSS